MTNTAQHTPAPWHVMDLRDPTRYSQNHIEVKCLNGGDTGENLNDGCNTIAVMHGADSEANAKLVAASPLLLSACEQAYNVMLNYHDASAWERDEARRALAAALIAAGK